MKVLYDDQVFATQRYGGISRYITEIATRTAEHAEVRVSAGMYLNRYLQEAENSQVLQVSGFHVDQDRAWRVRDRFNQWWTSRESKAFMPDVVHETYYRPKGLHHKKAKVVITVHDLIHEKYPDQAPNAAFHAHLKSQALVRADKIVSISETTKQDLLHHYPGIDQGKIVVIPHGHSFRTPSSNARLVVREAVNGRQYVLHVGHRAGYKRFADTVAALSLVKKRNKDLVLLAFGCGKLTESELGMIKGYGLNTSDVVYLEGSDDLLNAAYAEASVFCYPSLYEGFGIPVLEALAAGCHVICSDTPIFREVGKDAVKYFEACSAQGLANMIESVIGSAKLSAGLPMYSWHESAAAHYDLYLQLRG